MLGAAFLLVVAQSVAGLNDVTAATFTCNLALPDSTHFRMEGRFDESGMHSNLSALIHTEGDFAPLPADEVVILDATQGYRWSLDRGSLQFNAAMTRYLAGPAGTAAPVALFVLDGRRQVGGRHWGRFFVGAGLCEVRNVRAGEARQ
jgi:hypothetical protein